MEESELNKAARLQFWNHHFDPAIQVIVARQTRREEEHALHGFSHRHLRLTHATHSNGQKGVLLVQHGDGGVEAMKHVLQRVQIALGTARSLEKRAHGNALKGLRTGRQHLLLPIREVNAQLLLLTPLSTTHVASLTRPLQLPTAPHHTQHEVVRVQRGLRRQVHRGNTPALQLESDVRAVVQHARPRGPRGPRGPRRQTRHQTVHRLGDDELQHLVGWNPELGGAVRHAGGEALIVLRRVEGERVDRNLRDLAETVGLHEQSRLGVRGGGNRYDLDHSVKAKRVDGVKGGALEKRRLAEHDRFCFRQTQRRRTDNTETLLEVRGERIDHVDGVHQKLIPRIDTGEDQETLAVKRVSSVHLTR